VKPFHLGRSGRPKGTVCDTPAMPGGPVRFTLDSGETLSLTEDERLRVYEELWRLAPKPGAVSTAAVVHGATRQFDLYGAPIDLTPAQSAMLREAVALLHDPKEAEVTKIPAFHTSEEETPAVYHDNDECSEGKKIKQEHKVSGSGTDRRLCEVCAGLD
jgi:hypothetical protein